MRARRLTLIPFVADRQSVVDAHDLMARFGDDAGFEAAARADASRDIGNVSHYCRWRQIERLILILTHPDPVGTIH